MRYLIPLGKGDLMTLLPERASWLFTISVRADDRALLKRIAEETVAFGEYGYVFSFEKVDPGFNVRTRPHDVTLLEYRNGDEPAHRSRWMPVMFTDIGTEDERLLIRFGMDDATYFAEGLRRLTARYPAATFLCLQRYYKQRKCREWLAVNGVVSNGGSVEPDYIEPLFRP